VTRPIEARNSERPTLSGLEKTISFVVHLKGIGGIPSADNVLLIASDIGRLFDMVNGTDYE